MSLLKSFWLVVGLNIAMFSSVYLLSEFVYIRWTLSIIYVLYLPGYSLVELIFPSRKEVNGVERIAYSFGLSATVVILLCYLLNYLPCGISLTPLLISISMLTITCIVLATARKYRHLGRGFSKFLSLRQMSKETSLILLLSFVMSGVISYTLLHSGDFRPIGYDTLYHIKYTSTIVKSGRVPSTNPYFPQFPHAYTPGTHVLLATLIIIGDLNVMHLFLVLSALLIVPIVISFYALSRAYLKEEFAFLATSLFIFSSLVNPKLVATHGGVLFNCLFLPYASRLMGHVILPLFILSFLKLHRKRSIPNLITSGALLGSLVLSYHLMGLVAVGLLLTYLCFCIICYQGEYRLIGLNRRKKGDAKPYRLAIQVILLGVLFSSPYLSHILRSGLPSQLGAMQTYATFSFQNCINVIRPPLFFTSILAVLFINDRQLRAVFHREPVHKFGILASWIIFLILMANLYRVGIYLCNDMFIWFLIPPLSIVAAFGLSAIWNYLSAFPLIGRKKIFTLICFGPVFGTILLQIPLISLIPIRERFAFESGIKWLQVNAQESTVATDPLSSFYISSFSDVRVISIPWVVADSYYVKDWRQRTEDTKRIFGTNLTDSLVTLDKYGAKFVYISGGTEAEIFNTPYFEHVFPLRSFVNASSGAYDLDGDGVEESFDFFGWAGSDSYILANSTGSNVLALRCYFPHGAYGPIRIRANNVFIAEITADEPEVGRWFIYRVKVPIDVLKEMNRVSIRNLDPHNAWYLDWVGFEPIPTNVSQYVCPTTIYEVQYLSALDVGSYLLDLDFDGKPEMVDCFRRNDEKEYCLYSSSGRGVLGVRDLFHGSGPVDVFVNGKYIGSLICTEKSVRMKWLAQRLTIPEGTLIRGWNVIKFVNLDPSNEWFLSHVEMSVR